MSINNIFMLLLSGLHKLSQNRTHYPLPADLRYSLNFLAFYRGNDFPRTVEGLFNKTRQPLKDWWPEELPIPDEFDREAPVTTSDKELSEDAKDFLYDWAEETGVALSADLVAKNNAGDNLVISQLIDNLRDKYGQAAEKERLQIQVEYVTIRRFIIQTPYVTSNELRQLSYQLRYTNSTEFAEKAYYYTDDHTKDYWQCENCGPLIEKTDGAFTGRKTSVCNDHVDLTAKHIKKVAGAQNLRVLKPGLHLRVLIPGVPELRLYDWLQELRETHPEQLLGVELWPGLDRYDLRLCFKDENWAVDVKDYKSPYSLGKKLTPIYGEGALAYQKSFYVFPAYRLKAANYREIALEQAINKPDATELLTDEEFKGRVEEKIRQLTKKKKGAK